MTIETERLIIRATSPEDSHIFALWERDPSITEFFTMDADRSRDDILGEIEEALTDPSKEFFTLIDRGSGDTVGRIMLSRIDRHYDSLDITRIYIGPTGLRDRGLGGEALRAMLRYAFLDLGMERVTIDHFPENTRADHLYGKLGFRDEGIMRHSGKKDGRYIDLKLKSMLREEYEKKYLSNPERL